MKIKGKKICMLLFLFAIFLTGFGISMKIQQQNMNRKIRSSVVRFHVRASSDRKNDQERKRKVRNRVVAYLKPSMNRAENRKQALDYLKENLEHIKKEAELVLEKEGSRDEVNVYLTREIFPEKYYGAYSFPKGRYTALRIDIGKAAGHNWWCVMFPDLCITEENQVAASPSVRKKLQKSIGARGEKEIRCKKKWPWILQWLQ